MMHRIQFSLNIRLINSTGLNMWEDNDGKPGKQVENGEELSPNKSYWIENPPQKEKISIGYKLRKLLRLN